MKSVFKDEVKNKFLTLGIYTSISLNAKQCIDKTIVVF